MKKIALTVALTLLGLTTTFAQNSNSLDVGLNALIPVGDISDFSSFGLAADVGYAFGISDKFSVGPKLSYYTYFGKDIEITTTNVDVSTNIDNINFLPLTASAKYKFSERFFGALDLGYAIGISEGIDGAFFYKPQIGYQINDHIDAILSYSEATKKNADLTGINLAVVYRFDF